MTLTEYTDIEQGSERWYELRRGIITASVIGQFITPKTIKVANNVDTRALMAHLVAERITGHVEESYSSRAMDDGHFFEPIARDIYSTKIASVAEVAFIIRDDDGRKVGYSPDGVVSDVGLIEIKCPKQKQHLKTILADEIPLEHVAQIQCGLFVSGCEWLDFISYNSGMPLYVKRMTPDPVWQDAIAEASEAFEQTAAEMIAAYQLAIVGRPETERVEQYEEMVIG